MKKALLAVVFLLACSLAGCEPTDTSVTAYAQATTGATEIVTTPVFCEDSSTNEELVWITQSGSKYHCTADCSNMVFPRQVKKSCALSVGYTPCKICYP